MPSKISHQAQRSKIQLISSLLGCTLVLIASFLTVQAQPSENQVNALVEALRRAAPNTGIENDGLYSDWQIKPDNIVRWSKRCTGVAMTTEEFEANPIEAREILKCVMGKVFQEQYAASNNDESLAVLRVAAWWMTGDANQYDNEQFRAYTNKVLEFYRELS